MIVTFSYNVAGKNLHRGNRTGIPAAKWIRGGGL